MDLSERQKAILEYLSERNFVAVSELAQLLSVSDVTIRSELSDLERQGYLLRTRGGAVPSIHRNILERQKVRVEAKQRIAKKAAALVQHGDRILIEAGTTTALIAKYLISTHDVQVVTNSMLAFSLRSPQSISQYYPHRRYVSPRN